MRVRLIGWFFSELFVITTNQYYLHTFSLFTIFMLFLFVSQNIYLD